MLNFLVAARACFEIMIGAGQCTLGRAWARKKGAKAPSFIQPLFQVRRQPF
jgi:hypothetical protein